MIHESWPWKEELKRLIEDLSSITSQTENDRDEQNDFLIERALMYSAFVARLLIDSNKLTNRINDLCFPVSVIPCVVENLDEITPCQRRFPSHRFYDFENETSCSVPCRLLLNQIIHSCMVPSYEIDEAGRIVGFYVSSERKASEHLYRVELANWIQYLNTIATDEFISSKALFDPDKKKWIEARSQELP